MGLFHATPRRWGDSSCSLGMRRIEQHSRSRANGAADLSRRTPGGSHDVRAILDLARRTSGGSHGAHFIIGLARRTSGGSIDERTIFRTARRTQATSK